MTCSDVTAPGAAPTPAGARCGAGAKNFWGAGAEIFVGRCRCGNFWGSVLVPVRVRKTFGPGAGADAPRFTSLIGTAFQNALKTAFKNFFSVLDDF